MTEQELIQGCRKQNRKAQQELFSRYSPKFFGVCRRYIKNNEEAEDALIEGFYKVMSKISMYSGEGNFEGWMRRIMVNECLMKLRKANRFKVDVELENVEEINKFSIESELEAQDILDLLNQLPTGYRTIFNMYVIEGYKHREIADALGISINTSKSQLILAKKKLRTLLEERARMERS